jgi:pre-rRNA-processing protein TSR3
MKTPKNSVNLYCLHFKDCDPKKCTALKLNRLGFLKIIKSIEGRLSNAIILNPLARRELTYEDKKTIRRSGLIVLDCSWSKIIKLKQHQYKNARTLPPLISANPVNYGKWEKLNSAEALAAALYITGFKEHARKLLSNFRWNEEFWKINKKLFEKNKNK